MLPRCVLNVALVTLLVSRAAAGPPVRYFAIWGYAENAPAEEIEEPELNGRELGYWQLHFDSEGSVTEGIYHDGSGTAWLSFRYVEVDERIYADLYLANGTFLTRKSTNLKSRAPRWRAEP